VTAQSRRSHSRGTPAGDHGEENSERWLLTYADMITLLFVLFIVLFALSKVNEAKYRQFQQSLQEDKIVGVSMVQGTTVVAPRGAQPLNPTPGQLHKIASDIAKALAQVHLSSAVSLSVNSQGLVEGLVNGSTFFQTDSAQLSPQGAQIVDISAKVISRYPASIEVAGYTDNEPITGGPFHDNWNLAAARATTVVDEMTAVSPIDPSRVVAVSYGQYHPVASDASPAGRAQNRRVNIIVAANGTSSVNLAP
jgi:chemotaxis protein MotB